jgi:putative membrane protein
VLNQVLRSLFGGLFMGTADLVPGVSGGTIALVLGIYERLVASIKEGSSALGSILKGDVEAFRDHLRRVEWLFLIPLLAGILLAVVLLASFLEHQLEERPTILAGVFLGLVLASIAIAWRILRSPRAHHPLIAALVALGIFLLLGAGEGRVADQPALVVFFGAGALAICAMILPGISGSLILLMIGMYAPVLSAVTDRSYATLAVFAVGAIVGLAFFSQILNWALENHHDTVIAALVGLMAGSTRVLWPWPDGVESPRLGAPATDWPGVVIAVVVGAIAVYLITRLAPDDTDVHLARATGS